MMPASFFLAAITCFSVVGGPGQPSTHLLTRESVLHGSLPVATLPVLDDQRWVARGGSAIWLLDAGSRRVVRLLPREQEHPSKWELRGSWPLPAGIQVDSRRTGFLGLAPWGEDGTWLVDGETRAVWRLVRGAWEGPWALADEVADAVALGDGEVLVQTPAHSHSLFAVVGPGGEVRRRFGERRLALLAILDRPENTWRMALSANGKKLSAAHAYRALVRSYGRDGSLLGEFEIASPEAQRLSTLQQERVTETQVNPTTGCGVCRLVRLATALEMGTTGELLIRLGRSPAVERLDQQGHWLETVPLVRPDNGGEWLSAGFIVTGDLLVACERESLVGYRWRKTEMPVAVRVRDEDEKPVVGALVEILVTGGLQHRITTDAAGQISIPAPPTGAEVLIRIQTPGFRRFERLGTAPAVLAMPITLRCADTLCVKVSSLASHSPVPSFDLAVQRPAEGVGVVGIETIPALPIDNEQGSGCIDSPWEYPVTLVVRAEGYATDERKILERPEGEVIVELEPAAIVRLAVVDPQARPVPDAKVLLWPGDAAARPQKVVGQDYLASSNDRGEAVFSRLPAGKYRASVRCQGFLNWEEDWELQQGESTKRVVLERGARAVVRVTDRRTSAGVGNANVELDGHNEVDRRLTCTTGTNGTCTILAVPPGSLMASATAPGRAAVSRRITVPPNQAEVLVELSTAKGVRVRGRVRGCDWYPDSSLTVRMSAPGFEVRQAPVGPDGQFAIEEAPSGQTNVWVRDEAGGGGLLYQVVAIEEDRESQDIVLDLPRPVFLSGWVRQGDAWCVGCRVLLTLASSEVTPPRAERRADSSGHFEARLPRAGMYRLQIWTREGELGWDDALDVQMDSERTFDLGTGAVIGQVVNGNRMPVSSATVTASRYSNGTLLRQVTSSALGSFRLERLPAGTVRVSATRDGVWAHEEVTLEPGRERQVELVLEENRGFELRLWDVETTVPVRSAVFGIQDRSGGFQVLSLAGGPTGLFRLPVEASDVVAVVIGAPGFAISTLRAPGAGMQPTEVALSPRYRSFTLEVRPEAASPCSIVLVGQDGLPTALTVEAPPGPVPLQSRTAMLNLIPAGTYTLVVAPCQGTPMTRSLVLAPGTIPHVVLP